AEEEDDLAEEEDDLTEEDDDLDEEEEDLAEEEDDLTEDDDDLAEEEDDLAEEEDDLTEEDDDLDEEEEYLTGDEDSQNNAENPDAQETSETENTELDECLKDFEQSSWEQLTPEEQKEKTEQLADIIGNELNLENPPKVEYYYSEKNGDYGGYAASTNTIYINEKYLGDAKETVDTIAHESRHCWQHERAENPETAEDQAFKDNFDNYIKPEQDYQSYLEQPVEQDARDYAAGIADRIPESGETADNVTDKPADERKQDSGEPMTTGPPETVENSKTLTPDQLPDDFESKNEIEYRKLSPEAVRKTEAAGLSDEKVQDLRVITRGDKPEPETYLSKEYIDQHLKKFEDSGCCKFIPGKPVGTVGEGKEGVFVLDNNDKNRILQEAVDPETGKIDIKKLEESLGCDPGYLGSDPYIVQVDKPENLRMSTGNEENAWQDKWVPGGVTSGGTNEAVIDPIEKGNYSYQKVSDIDIRDLIDNQKQ
ncbi:MAG: hypothetical protein IJF78_14255, partial [Clostridia bacterium]|nr:hypothetical protein [Clostridia bacterium]